MEGPCIDNCNAQTFAIKEERLDLSTLLEVSSPTEVLHKRSTVLSDFDLCLDLAVWKLRNKCLNKKKAIEKQMIKISISQWNAWSVQNETKIQFIQSLPGNVVAIQEIWQQNDNVERIGELIGHCEREGRGGGSATIKLCDDKILVKSKFRIGLDSHAVKIFIRNTYFWVVNVYLNEGSIEQMQELFGELKSLIPENEWDIVCCIGDFNIDLCTFSHELKLLKKLCKLFNLTIVQPSEQTTKHGSVLDYVLVGKNIIAKEQSIVTGPSDHRAINWSLEITNVQKRRTIKIPCKKIANTITDQLLTDNAVVDAVSFVHKLGKLKKKNKRNMLKIMKPKPIKNDALMKLLLKLQEPHDIETTINEHWANEWKQTECQRYSEFSAQAYQKLQKILKYHLFEKRDGGIINCVKRENGEIESESEKVNELLATTMKEIQIDSRWEFLEEKEFPKLNRLNEKEMDLIVNKLTTGKAIAFDGVSDTLFKDKTEHTGHGRPKKPTNKEKTTKKLRNLWRIPLHKYAELQDTWDTRLVPLNKVFPNVPTRKELRPIAVQSPLVKLLEARFLPKLQDYLDYKLDRSQTGFIQKMGIQVNLVRALERITMRTQKKMSVYGLFIDFSNAYNSIPHALLFKKLREKKVLEDDEVEFLEQLYARYRLRIGKTRIRSNKGVAQGSVISPALFNIFIEDLSQELQEKAGISFEDLLYYADDLLALCTSIDQVRNAVRIISDWSMRNGMQLNKKKSGIVIFVDRRSHDVPNMMRKKENGKSKLIPSKADIEGVPICEKYKYLGTILTPKLDCSEQISFIKRKAGFLLVKLYPYLKNASADARKDM